MPEGPSIVILKEAVQNFKGKKIIAVSGNSKLDIKRLEGKIIADFKHGQTFPDLFKRFTVSHSPEMFGSYRINETKDAVTAESPV